MLAMPLADSISRTQDTYLRRPQATVDKAGPSVDFDLNSRYRLGKVEFEAALLCFSFRRGFDIYDSEFGYYENLRTRATIFQGGLRWPIPSGSWDIVLGAAVGYIRATAEYSDSFSSGTFSDDGPSFELSLGAEKFVSPQVSLGPFLRYRFARLANFQAADDFGRAVYLSEWNQPGSPGPDLYILDAFYLNALPGAEKAVFDMGGFSLGLELQYHY
jgi:hypothetical protein